jgi:hypothetical protein
VAELRVFALEILDNLLTGEIKQIVLPLLDDLSVAERLEQMSVRFPQQQMTPDDRFHDVVESHFDRAFFWTRSCMLYQIGLSDSHAHFEQVEKGLVDKESVIRETSLWCLEKLDPPDLRRRVSGFIGDRSKQVSDIARAIYTTLPDPEPDGAN